MTALTARYDEALALAAHLHREQRRKGTSIPYLSHLLAVSSLVLEAGGDEDQAIAGLLHDSLEDQSEQTSYADLRDRFGPGVADVVRACSDTEVVPKPPWRQRKQAYLEHLETADPQVLLVSRADKLHNARAILTDLREQGQQLWTRFSADRQDQLWYYRSLAEVFTRRLPTPQSQELARTVEAIAQVAAAAPAG